MKGKQGNSFEYCLETCVRYHRYELSTWLNENYKCEPVSLPTCIEYYNIDAFLYFLEHGHSIDEIDKNGYICLHQASWIGYLPVVQYLIEKGANVESKDEYQRTPLHIACLCGNLPIVQYLIEKGANIEGKDQDQKTPLHLASSWGRTDIVKYLISKGANKHAITFFGMTPYDYAHEDETKELLKCQGHPSCKLG